MRAVMLIVGAGACGLASGCGSTARAESIDGTLVLELGGDHESLRESLRAAGVVVRPTVEPEPALPAANPPDEPRGLERALPGRGEPRGEESPAPRFLEVRLGPSETLVLLARRHLGSGERYREILKCNGWTLEQATRLKIGTLVRIPIASGDQVR